MNSCPTAADVRNIRRTPVRRRTTSRNSCIGVSARTTCLLRMLGACTPLERGLKGSCNSRTQIMCTGYRRSPTLRTSTLLSLAREVTCGVSSSHTYKSRRFRQQFLRNIPVPFNDPATILVAVPRGTAFVEPNVNGDATARTVSVDCSSLQSIRQAATAMIAGVAPPPAV